MIMIKLDLEFKVSTLPTRGSQKWRMLVSAKNPDEAPMSMRKINTRNGEKVGESFLPEISRGGNPKWWRP